MIAHRGILGLSIIILSEILLFSGVEFVARWFTPIVWIGYILLMDHVNFRISGSSWIMNRRKDFLLMILLSIICWTLFEVYNLHLKNWEYLNLPENMWVRYFGYGISFATIFPGVFETFDFLQNIGLSSKLQARKGLDLRRASNWLAITGLVFLVLPLLLPETDASYLFGLVWMGFIFLLEPLNDRLGFKSLLDDIRRGDYSSFVNLLVAGAICGLLWEFWNYWALTRWVYMIPLPSGFKYFEMPVLGFLGFLPFAIECYSMYNFCTMNEKDTDPVRRFKDR